MTQCVLKRASALGVALALACATAQAAKPATQPASPPDVVTDAAGAWAWQFANGDVEAMWPGYEVVEQLGYTDEGVDADACRAHAAEMKRAVELAPISIRVHRAAMLCAEATGDDAGAERELAALAALSRHALAGATDNRLGKPIRVLLHRDVYALIATMGLEYRYEYYERTHMARTWPFVVAAWDPEKKVERHLRFDWVDGLAQFARNPATRYPSFRTDFANGGVNTNAKSNVTAAVDQMAWRTARGTPDVAAKIGILRQATVAGGVQSPRIWLLVCADANAPKNCGDGFVDAVLPMAEKQQALPMALLAYAYNEGIGVPRDPAAGRRLLDAADQRWDRKGASAWYATLYRDTHEKATLPADLAARVAASAAAGNEDAKLVLVADRLARDPKLQPTPEDIALLSSKPQNGQGDGFLLLAWMAGQRDEPALQKRYYQAAADAGSPEAQGWVAGELLYGDDAKPADEPRAIALLEQAAHGANNWAARQLAWRAEDKGDSVAAWNWLMDAGNNDDVDALLYIARLYESERPGINGKLSDAVDMYRQLATYDVAEANRRLSALAREGRGVPKDLKEARRLLEVDAEKGDHESEGQLGLSLLRGVFGAVDEAEGVKWVERAIAGKDETATSDYAYWLWYMKKTPDARKHAVEIWQKGLALDSTTIFNNYAWVLCTTEDASLRDGKAGLAIALKMHDPEFGAIDTVAACYAAAGEFDRAKATQQDAIDRFHVVVGLQEKRNGAPDKAAREANAAQLKELNDRLALYVAGKDYRSDLQ